MTKKNIPPNPFDDNTLPPDPFADDTLPPNPFADDITPNKDILPPDPFADEPVQNKTADQLPPNPFADETVTTSQELNDTAHSSLSNKTNENISTSFDPFKNLPIETKTTKEPVFETFDTPIQENDDLEDPFANFVPPNNHQSQNENYYEDEDYDDSYNDNYEDNYNEEWEDNEYDDYDDEYEYHSDSYVTAENTLPPNGEKPTVKWLLETYGGMLDDDNFFKMKSMIEPEFDYTLEHEDGLGAGRVTQLLRGRKGLSQVNADDLAGSSYIAEMEDINGYYSPPNSSKIIACQSCKGGAGKTTASVMLSTQLNWFFNPDLMLQRTTAMNARVLIFSVNEFDDITTHGIGYDEPTSKESEQDGKNIAELLSRINETSGSPVWEDISHCFVSTEKNRVFYLPSLTQREMLSGGYDLTADDYKKVLDVCSQFFQFIIVDCPDIFYQERHDVMNFVFSVADVIVMIVEPDSRSSLNLYHFFDGMQTNTNKMPLDPSKCILLVNKYVTQGNPYMPIPPYGQISYEEFCKPLEKYFTRFLCMPFTRPRGCDNILWGTDPKVKFAAAQFADAVLETIDNNDRKKIKH